jgi:hypothetical protein
MSERLYFIPRGLSRIEAARYVGVSPSLFDQMVKDGRMPGPKRINNAARENLVARQTAIPVDATFQCFRNLLHIAPPVFQRGFQSE